MQNYFDDDYYNDAFNEENNEFESNLSSSNSESSDNSSDDDSSWIKWVTTSMQTPKGLINLGNTCYLNSAI